MHSRDPRFTAPDAAVEARVQGLIDQMTPEEKISLLAGQANPGSTTGLERLGIPSLRLADGPLGVHWWCEAVGEKLFL
jgi:beta-glucosidase